LSVLRNFARITLMSRLDRGVTLSPGMHAVGVVAEERSLPPVESTTSFFREPSAIKTIVEGLAPRIGPQVTVASVGCSTGEEVYSLLFYANTNGWGDNFRVDGFDYTQDRIERGVAGIYEKRHYYAEDFTDEAIRHMLEEGGVSISDSKFEVAEDVKKRASFDRWDITQGPLPKRYPIIMCANVLYHYLDYARGRKPLAGAILRNVADSLMPGGFLVGEARREGGRYEQALFEQKVFKETPEFALPYISKEGASVALVLQAA